MKVRNMRARMCAVLIVSLFSSITFAQTTSVVTDRASLTGTDFIDWQSQDDGVNDYTWMASPASIFSNGGVAVTVSQQVAVWSLIVQEPSPWFRETNMPDGEFLYDTSSNSNSANPIAFSDFDGLGICGLGTQVAPGEPGPFVARIEAFDSSGIMESFDVNGDSSDTNAKFIGISSTDPMSRVEISLQEAAGGRDGLAAWYAINRVEFRACVSVPHISCEGFAAPLNKYPVKAKKNGVLPLRMKLFDQNEFELTDVELIAAPVVMVMLTASGEENALDVSGEVLSSGQASDGNQFRFTDDDNWQFNLRSKNYSAPGTYLVTAVSGDESEYVIDPSCVTSFVKN